MGPMCDPSSHPHDLTLDVLGLACPEPITRLQELMAGLEGGTVIEVLSDDGGIQWDLPAWCISTGNTLLALTESGRVWKGYVRLTVRRAASAGTSPAPADSGP